MVKNTQEIYVRNRKNGVVLATYPNTKKGLFAAFRYAEVFDAGLDLFVYGPGGRLKPPEKKPVLKRGSKQKLKTRQEKVNIYLDKERKRRVGIFKYSVIAQKELQTLKIPVKYVKIYLESRGYKKQAIEKRIGKHRIHSIFWVEPGKILTDAHILRYFS